MNNRTIKYYISIALAIGILSACKKTWNQRDTISDEQLKVNLFQQIQSNANLSLFTSLLTKTGYDKVISSSKRFTVWAPVNAAMQDVDPAILADTAKAKQFVANHIANLTYLTTEPQPSMRIRTLSGKNVTFTATGIDEANITKADTYVSNGVLQIIDKALLPKLNIWEYINSQTLGLNQKTYLQSQNYIVIDTSKATVSSIDPVTGKPILKPGTGEVQKNHYFDNVADISNEDQQYTYIILTDDALNTEANKISKYFATSTVDSTTSITNFYVLKDMVINGLYTANNLPDTLLSVNNVKVPINKAAITQTYNASNGIVYVMNAVNFRVQDKITPIIIEGEKPSVFARSDKGANIFYRTKKDLNGNVFNDLLIAGTGGSTLTASFWAGYNVPNVYSCKYTVSWRVVNDVVTTGWTQKLAFDTPLATTFPYTSVGRLNYDEVTLGTYTKSNFGLLPIYAVGGNANSTAIGSNGSISIDYIKLVPILQ